MNKKLLVYCSIAAVAVAGIAGAALAPVAGAGGSKLHVTPVKITVTATEFKFKLSRTSVPIGTRVTFTVVNRGKIAHDFRILGTSLSTKTPTLAPGKSAKLTVTFTKKGRFAYLCTLPGHAGAGMKGSFAVGVAPVKAPVATTAAATTATPATTAATTAAPTPAPAPAPAAGPETLVGDPAAGAAVFTASGCGGCHTLAAAGANGTVGPNLDAIKPSQGTIKATIQAGAVAGGAQMPAFNLSATDLNNITAYVYKSTHP